MGEGVGMTEALAPYAYWRPSPPLPVGTDVERFWSYVIKGAPETCWPWRTLERGRFWWRGPDGAHHHELSSRLAYRLSHNVSLGPREVVAHRCDWKACCNPACLECVSQKKNSQDMADRGLHPYMGSGQFRRTRDGWWADGANGPGEANGSSKLTNELVQAIRRRYVRGVTRQVDLAADFGVGQTTISRVIRCESWSHLERGAS